MMSYLKKWVCVLAALFLGGEGAWADSEKSEVNASPPAYISWVAFGDRPARRFKFPVKKSKSGKLVSDLSGIPIPLDPKEGTMPPRSLYLKDGASWRRISLGFNHGSGAFKVPSGRSLLFYKKIKPGEYEPYVKLPKLTPASQWLVLFSRGKMEWKKEPVVSKLRLNSKALINKNVLFRNGSRVPIVFSFGATSKYELKPGRRVSFNLPLRKTAHRVRAEVGWKQKIRLFDTVLNVSDQYLTVIVFYDHHDSKCADNTVGVARMTFRRLLGEE